MRRDADDVPRTFESAWHIICATFVSPGKWEMEGLERESRVEMGINSREEWVRI
jgi:hypothetical protein